MGEVGALKQVYKTAFLTLAALLLLSEAFLALTGSRLLRAPLGARLVSEPLLKQRLRALADPAPKTLLLLGDSVLWGSALRERGIRDWRTQTPGSAVAQALPADWRLVELSADGLMLPDLEALLERGLALKPAAVVLELNYRMLGPDAPHSRPWLDPQAKPGFDAEEALRRHWRLFRFGELASATLFDPSLKDVLSGVVDRIFGTEADEDGRQALLDLKLQPYYSSPAQADSHPALQALRRISTRLREAQVPAFVFLTPQNLERVEDLLDRPAYDANRKALARAAQGLRYADWSNRRPKQGAFLDHCHFDAAGNAELGRWIAEARP